jgi:hypothetical protein
VIWAGEQLSSGLAWSEKGVPGAEFPGRT